MDTVFIVMNVGDNQVCGIFSTIENAKEFAENYCQDHSLVINTDVMCWEVMLDEQCEPGVDDQGLVTL